VLQCILVATIQNSFILTNMIFYRLFYLYFFGQLSWKQELFQFLKKKKLKLCSKNINIQISNDRLLIFLKNYSFNKPLLNRPVDLGEN